MKAPMVKLSATHICARGAMSHRRLMAAAVARGMPAAIWRGPGEGGPGPRPPPSAGRRRAAPQRASWRGASRRRRRGCRPAAAAPAHHWQRCASFLSRFPGIHEDPLEKKALAGGEGLGAGWGWPGCWVGQRWHPKNRQPSPIQLGCIFMSKQLGENWGTQKRPFLPFWPNG